MKKSHLWNTCYLSLYTSFTHIALPTFETGTFRTLSRRANLSAAKDAQGRAKAMIPHTIKSPN
jgi:hypothetical protein